jgi:hypothetical protein
MGPGSVDDGVESAVATDGDEGPATLGSGAAGYFPNLLRTLGDAKVEAVVSGEKGLKALEPGVLPRALTQHEDGLVEFQLGSSEKGVSR